MVFVSPSEGRRRYTTALKASDQLRQRVAWALSQIYVASDVDIGRESYTEPWAAYGDRAENRALWF